MVSHVEVLHERMTKGTLDRYSLVRVEFQHFGQEVESLVARRGGKLIPQARRGDARQLHDKASRLVFVVRNRRRKAR